MYILTICVCMWPVFVQQTPSQCYLRMCRLISIRVPNPLWWTNLSPCATSLLPVTVDAEALNALAERLMHCLEFQSHSCNPPCSRGAPYWQTRRRPGGPRCSVDTRAEQQALRQKHDSLSEVRRKKSLKPVPCWTRPFQIKCHWKHRSGWMWHL